MGEIKKKLTVYRISHLKQHSIFFEQHFYKNIKSYNVNTYFIL